MARHIFLIICFFLVFITTDAAAQENRSVTLADNGRTITLKVNETFLLKLGEGYDWNITIDDRTIFSRKVNVLVVRGAQGIYVAHMPGRAALTAVGSPECLRSQPPCARPTILFKVFVVVTEQEGVQKSPDFDALASVTAMVAAIFAGRIKSRY